MSHYSASLLKTEQADAGARQTKKKEPRKQFLQNKVDVRLRDQSEPPFENYSQPIFRPALITTREIPKPMTPQATTIKISIAILLKINKCPSE